MSNVPLHIFVCEPCPCPTGLSLCVQVHPHELVCLYVCSNFSRTFETCLFSVHISLNIWISESIMIAVSGFRKVPEFCCIKPEDLSPKLPPQL